MRKLLRRWFVDPFHGRSQTERVEYLSNLLAIGWQVGSVLALLMGLFWAFVREGWQTSIPGRAIQTILFAGTLLVFAGIATVATIRSRVRPRGSPSLDLLRGLDPGLQQPAVEAMTHSMEPHGESPVDTTHEVRHVESLGVVDRHGSYFGFYERIGQVRSGMTCDGMLVHAASAGPKVDFERLRVIAFDVATGESLRVECRLDTSLCQIWFIRFSRQKQEREPVHVRFLFVWPHSMDPTGDVDGLSFRMYLHPPDHVRAVLQLPSQPGVIRGVRGGRWVQVSSRSDPTRGLWSIEYDGSLGGADDVWLYFRTTDPTAQLASLSEMMTVHPATEADLEQVYLLEQAAEYNVPIDRGTLAERRSAFPEGFLVGTFRDKVGAYLELMRIEPRMYGRFLDGKPYSNLHSPHGRVLCGLYMSVAKPLRNHGLAGRLLEEAQALGCSLGVDEVHMMARPGTERLYERSGFARRCVLPQYIRGEDHALMVWCVPPQRQYGSRPARSATAKGWSGRPSRS